LFVGQQGAGLGAHGCGQHGLGVGFGHGSQHGPRSQQHDVNTNAVAHKAINDFTSDIKTLL